MEPNNAKMEGAKQDEVDEDVYSPTSFFASWRLPSLRFFRLSSLNYSRTNVTDRLQPH